MLTNSSTDPTRILGVPSLLRRWWQFNPLLTILTVTMVITAIAALAGVVLDPRLVNNAPVWAKTAKFAISIALFSATFLWMLPYLTSRPRVAQWIANSMGAILFFEMALIVIQAVRGRITHFNYTTPLDGAIYSAMGATIMMLWVIGIIGTVLLMRQKMADPALAWGIRLGAVMMVIGMALAFLMTMPNQSQITGMMAGEPLSFIGAHTVGAPDGGEGLPLIGWSTTHGDLRIAHFIGLHGLQAIPLVGWWLGQRREAWLTMRHRVALVWVSAGGYLGLTLLSAWQALRGQPLLLPDALTLGVLAAVIVGTVASAVAIVAVARRTTPAPVPA